jgi:hypothetical protein
MAQRLAAPEGADQGDSLAQRGQRLGRLAHRPAHGADGVPEGAGAEAELEAAAAELVERGGLLGQHQRRAQGQIGDVGEDADAAGLPQEVADERHRVEVFLLVGMVLDADQVVTEIVDDVRDLDGALGISGGRIEEEAELHIVSVIRHGLSFWWAPGPRRLHRVILTKEGSRLRGKHRGLEPRSFAYSSG